MRAGWGRGWPTLAIACLALFAALGGTVYAAKRIDGHAVKVKSLPGNRLLPRSVPGNRLRPGTIPGGQIAPGSLTGAQVDAATLGRVPSAAHAERADSAGDAATALHARSADSATRINGYEAGCPTGTRAFAGACWQLAAGETALEAAAAARACAALGGELPGALSLAAFAVQPGILLAGGDEWSGDIAGYSGVDSYTVVTVSSSGEIKGTLSTATKRFRCVLPLVR
ncbi:MAG: hypothetical protein R2725_14060 [Solirubrobacterales bacterium]